MKMNLPNKLTIVRVLLIPVFIIFLLWDVGKVGDEVALVVFCVAAFTDFLDGYIARKYDLVTNFGKFMDPLADKMLVLSAMCYFVERVCMPGWVVALVLFREFAVSGLRLIAVEQQRVIAAAWSGKIKTAATMVCIALMLLIPAPGIGDSAPDLIALLSSAVIVLTTVYSGIEYFVKNRDVFKDVD